MKQALIWILLLAVVAGLAYWLISQNGNDESALEPVDTTEEPTTAPEDTSAQPTDETVSDYIGLSEADAAALAAQNDVPFRVVERDGEMLPTTRDYRPGRINAVVVDGIVTAYTVEGSEDAPVLDKGEEQSGTGTHDAIIGLTQADAEAYAETNEVPFRIGSVDGEARPVTMDYRPGRITAELMDGVVTGYSVE